MDMSRQGVWLLVGFENRLGNHANAWVFFCMPCVLFADNSETRFVRTFGYYVLSVDHGHRQSALFALSLFWIKRTLFRTYLFSFPLRVCNNRVSLYIIIITISEERDRERERRREREERRAFLGLRDKWRCMLEGEKACIALPVYTTGLRDYVYA